MIFQCLGFASLIIFFFFFFRGIDLRVGNIKRRWKDYNGEVGANDQDEYGSFVGFTYLFEATIEANRATLKR